MRMICPKITNSYCKDCTHRNPHDFTAQCKEPNICGFCVELDFKTEEKKIVLKNRYQILKEQKATAC
jgi:hypothetical protein